MGPKGNIGPRPGRGRWFRVPPDPPYARPRSPTMNRTITLGLLPLAFASLSVAAADPWDAPFNFQVGAFQAKASTSARLDSDLGGNGTTVNFESTLGMDKDKTMPTFDFTWR